VRARAYRDRPLRRAHHGAAVERDDLRGAERQDVDAVQVAEELRSLSSRAARVLRDAPPDEDDADGGERVLDPLALRLLVPVEDHVELPSKGAAQRLADLAESKERGRWLVVHDAARRVEDERAVGRRRRFARVHGE